MFGCQIYYKYYVLTSNYFDFIEGVNEDELYSLGKHFMTQNNSSVVDGTLANDKEGEYTLQIRYPTIPTQTHSYTKVYSVYCFLFVSGPSTTCMLFSVIKRFFKQ